MFEPRKVSEEEKACIRILADHFARGTFRMNAQGAMQAFKDGGVELDEMAFGIMIRVLEGYGVVLIHATIADARSTISTFAIHAESIQRVREMDEYEQKTEEPRDIVEKIGQAARKNRFVGWIIIVSIILAAILTIANQAMQLMQNLGWIPKP